MEFHRPQGFALLYAALAGSLLLTVGLAIFNLTIKELILSSAGRESQFAFFAADTGVECALFWDYKGSAFSTSTTSTIECNNTLISDMGGKGYGVPSVFTLDFAPEPYCVTVFVTKFVTHPRTVVEARGYNTCDEANPRRVERAIRVMY